GAVLYEMATGKRAFQGDSAISTLAAVVGREPSPLRSLAPATPRGLDRIIKKCLAKSPDQRYQTAAKVREELRNLTRTPARRLWLVAAVLAAAAALALTTWKRFDGTIRNGGGVSDHSRSVVVLPFANVSKDPEMEYLVDGLAESLTDSLSRI